MKTLLSQLKNLPEANIFMTLTAFSLGIIFMDTLPLCLTLIIFFLSAISAVLSKKNWLIILAVLMILGGCDYFAYRLVPKNHISRINPQIIKSLEGIVCSDPEKGSESYSFYLSVRKTEIPGRIIKNTGKIIVYLKTDTEIHQGDRIKLTSYFFSPKPQTNPIKYDYSLYLQRKNIYTATSVKEKNQICVLEKPKHPPLLHTLKNHIINLFKEKLDPKTADILMGMVLGNGYYLDKDTYSNFINTSTLHLLAASGLNCGVLLGILYYLFWFVEVRKKNLIIIPVLWFYAALINFPGSILRATVMCSLVLLCQSVKRKTSFRHILFLSAFLILIASPGQIFDTGFQLSYLCLIGLLYICPVMNRPIYRFYYRKTENLYSPMLYFYNLVYLPFCISLTSYIGVSVIITPISIYYFNYISFAGLWTNILVGLSASVIFVLSVLFLFVYYIPYVNTLFVFLLNNIAKFILKTVNTTGNWEYSSITVKTPNIISVILFYAVLLSVILFFFLRYKSDRLSKKLKKA
ncbi:MAG: ComEC family competence protein [Armatimonadetes bacterium]|nr:ComEC family competence protein [Candidatus Hippobium faecium]